MQTMGQPCPRYERKAAACELNSLQLVLEATFASFLHHFAYFLSSPLQLITPLSFLFHVSSCNLAIPFPLLSAFLSPSFMPLRHADHSHTRSCHQRSDMFSNLRAWFLWSNTPEETRRCENPPQRLRSVNIRHY